MTDQVVRSDDYPIDQKPSTDSDAPPGDGSGGVAPRRRRLLLIGTAAVAAFAGWIVFGGSSSSPEVTSSSSLNLGRVVRTDLVQQVSFEGTLGSVEDDPVTAQIGGTVTELASAGDTVVQGEVLYSIDGDRVMLLYGDLPAFRDLAVGEDTITVSNRLNGTITWVAEPGTVIEQGDVLFMVDGAPVVVLYGEMPAYRRLFDASTNLTGPDVLQLEAAIVALGHDPEGTVTVDGEFTYNTDLMVERWQDAIGAEVDGSVELGEIVFLPGAAQVLDVLATPGDQAGSGGVVTVATGEPATGTDVLQLEEAMVALGFDVDGALVADGVYTTETTQAVRAFQAASGLPVDGVIGLGEVVFLPDAVRITSQIATKGSRVNTGTAVLGISSSEKVVRLDLPADEQGLMALGDGVIVVLPDFTEVPATVISVAQTATRQPEGPATFEVFVKLDDPTPAGILDEAPVDVLVVSGSVQNVVAVPVTALVALIETGYAVEVVNADGSTRLVAVEIGFFADGLVEVNSSTLKPEDQVVLP